MESKNIIREIRYAIANNDIEELYRLKDICDRLHAGYDEYNGYTKLPEDQLYEEMNDKIKNYTYHSLSGEIEGHLNSLATEMSVINKKGLNHAVAIDANGNEVNGNVCFTHSDKLPDMWMGSIPKQGTIAVTPSALLLPKFDGCSCGVRYVRSCVGKLEPNKATTRGVDNAFRKQSSDILQKFLTISEPLTACLNSDRAKSFVFRGRPFSTAETISIRGEIVLRNKVDTFSAPAAFVAGKINGGMDVWDKSVSKITFNPFEIMKVTFPDEEYVPTQDEAIQFFTAIGASSYEVITHDLDESSLDFVKDHFKHLSDTLTEPIDGVVYCSKDWRYPQTKEGRTPANYGKLAWKPSSEGTSILRSVDYTIARDGKITFILNFDPIKIGPKTYKEAKTAPTRMQKLNGIGIGSVITIEICNDINPLVKDYEEDPSVTPYILPTICPFCKSPLKHSHKKDVYTITCENKECPEVLIQKMKNFLKILKIKGIAEGKLRKLGKITLENVNTVLMKNSGIVDSLRALTLAGFMGAIGFGTSAQIERATANVNNRTPLADNIDLLDSIAAQMDDPFVYDVVEFVLLHITNA